MSKDPKSMKPMTIEEIFSSVSTAAASGINPPPARVVLTPRSAEACLKHGINPEILRIRDLDSFWEPGTDKAIHRLRHEAYSQRRHEMMRVCRTERKRLINAELRAQEDFGGMKSEKKSKLTPEQILAEQAKQNATMIELEQKRLAKMRKRQEKEIEQVLTFEQKMSELQEDLQRKMEEEKKRHENLQKQREKRMRQMVEERRQRDIRKKAQEDAAEERRVQVAREMFLKDKALAEERIRKERGARMAARIKEEERQAKQEQYKLQTQRILKEQQRQIQTRLKQLEEAEKKRTEMAKKKRKADKKRIREKRKAVEERLERNLMMAKEVEEKRKEDFYAKQDHHELLRAVALEEKEQQRILHYRNQAILEEKRKMVLRQTRNEEEDRKGKLLKKFQEDEVNVARIQQKRNRQLLLQKEKKNLKKLMKLENVERVKRIQEYKRLETLKKIHDDDKRTQSMLEQKQQIIAERKKTAVSTKIQKDYLMKLVDEAKTASSGKAVKVLQKALEVPDNKKRKSKSANRKKKYADEQMRSQSAQPLGPKPEAPSLTKRINEMNNLDPEPQPYVSPYEKVPAS